MLEYKTSRFIKPAFSENFQCRCGVFAIKPGIFKTIPFFHVTATKAGVSTPFRPDFHPPNLRLGQYCDDLQAWSMVQSEGEHSWMII